MPCAGCHYVGATLEGAWRIQLCGTLVVRAGERRLDDALPGRQGRALLAFLALHRGHELDHDRLADALWGEQPPGAPEAGVRALVSKLRAALGDGVVTGRGGARLSLPVGAWVDVEAADDAIHRAESAAGRGAWHEAWAPSHVALNVSRREFLPGHRAPWVQERRDHLAGVRQRALRCWAQAGLGIGGGELTDAERAARVLVAEAPYREDAHVLLMEVLAARGNAAEALRVYDGLRQRLRDELGVSPGAELRALHARLLN
jgi:DNA-binding SARP family transcriptional activator